MSKFLHHAECPSCGSSNNLAVYDDHSYCFSEGCGYKTQGDKNIPRETPAKEIKKIRPLVSKPQGPLKGRNISSTAVAKFQVILDDDKAEAVFPKFSLENNHVANQVRYPGKEFSIEGDLGKAGLFGRQAFPPGGRSITVTEGYYDSLAAYDLTGTRYPNVGVMSASSAKKEVVADFEYLDSFEEIVINFDSDEPGQRAAKEVASLFAPGKVRILKLDKYKDANEYLMNGMIKEYINEWHRAPVFMPDGLQLGNDPKLLDEIIKYKEPRSIAYPWKGLNLKTYGIRTSELVLLTADTGVGKTSVCKEIEYVLLTDSELIAEDVGVGFLHLEEPKRDLTLGLMSIHKNKPYHFPDVDRTEEELVEAYNEVVNTSRVVIWDHFGSNDIDVVLSKIRHMAALGCKYIFLDHLSIIVSDQSGDERKQLDEISTKIKTLTMNLDIAVIAVIHINRQGQVRGSAGPEQVANIIIRLERDKKELDPWRRNVTTLSVEKNRKYGRTGPAAWLFYNEMTGRLEEMDDEMVERYNSGGGATGNEFAMMGRM